MAEYIDRDDLIYKLHNLCKINCAHYPSERDIYCGMCMINDVLNLIKGCPTAEMCPHYIRNIHDRGDDSLCKKAGCEVKDVQPVVYGHWVKKPLEETIGNGVPIYAMFCSVCGWMGNEIDNFCSNCGARME